VKNIIQVLREAKKGEKGRNKGKVYYEQKEFAKVLSGSGI